MLSASPPEGGIVRFGTFELDPKTGELRRAGLKVSLAPQPLTILLRLLACPGEIVTRDELRRELWPDATFGDFEHGLNAAIKRLREALGDSAETPRVIETMPRRGYRFLPVVIRAAAPVSERAVPASAPGDPESSAVPAATTVARATRAVAVIATLVIVATAAVLWRLLRPAPPVVPRTIAVLPFTIDRPDSEEQYFSDGMTDAILAKVAGIESLRVTPRAVAAHVARSERDPRRVGQALGVAYVLDGVTHRADRRLRIDVSLTDSQSGYQVWAESFEGDFEDVFAFQERIAQRIASALQIRLSATELRALKRRPADNPAAYDEYLKGRSLIRAWDAPTRAAPVGNPKMLLDAQAHFERAFTLDPTYAAAIVGLAQVHLALYEGGRQSPGPSAPPPYDRSMDRLDRGERLAGQALALDPQLADGHEVLGSLRCQRAIATKDPLERERAVAELREAIRLNPDYSWTWTVLSWVLLQVPPARAVEAEQAARGAIAADPREFWAYYQLGSALRLQRRYDESLAALRHGLALHPEWASMHANIGSTCLEKGDLDCARREYQAAAQQEPNAPRAHVGLAAVNAGLHETEKALVELERAFVLGYGDFGALDAMPQFSDLRLEPRYQRLVDKYRHHSP